MGNFTPRKTGLASEDEFSNILYSVKDMSIFKDKKLYWQNMSTVASEIARSNDVFIKHNFDNHDGEVPVWAAVEVLSFGSITKLMGFRIPHIINSAHINEF